MPPPLLAKANGSSGGGGKQGELMNGEKDTTSNATATVTSILTLLISIPALVGS